MATHNQRDINRVATSRTPIITMPRSINLRCLLLSVLFLPFCSSRDTITVDMIKYPGGTTLVSAGEQFELGFFSPKGSSSSERYIGIWYYRSDPPIVVWVANRKDPLISPTASFALVDGDLKLLNEGQVIWQTKVGDSSSSTRSAKLHDSGNLVLIDGTETILWQSFDNPTDKFLPGMLMTKNFNLTSWASHDDPKPGNFTFQMDQEGGNSNYDVIRDLRPHWKSGVYGTFIQADQMWDVISFLLSNFTPSVDTTTQPAGPSPTLGFGNINLSNYYTNTWLVMNYDGQIQYFRLENRLKLWFAPAGRCSVFSACGKYGSYNDKNGNKTMCRCLPGFRPAQPDMWNSGDFSEGCLRESPICGNNSNNSAHHFLSLKKMRAGRPNVPPIQVDNEEQCRQKCLNVCSCQAYSFVEDQRQRIGSDTSMCYTWSDDLDHIQELAQDGHDLYVRVQFSDIGSSNRSCGTCGTNLVPYPLSTGQSCGDPLYSAFSCNNTTAQLYFGHYRVTSIDPQARTFTIQARNESRCTSSGQMEINLHLNQSSPFHVRSGCGGGETDLSTGDSLGSEVKIGWSDPKEPICNSSKDCDWPHATCKKASDGITRCLCNSGFSWRSFSVNCSQGENVDLADWPETLATVFMNNRFKGNIAIRFYRSP